MLFRSVEYPAPLATASSVQTEVEMGNKMLISGKNMNVCKECGNEFVFTAGEQEFYAEKGFTNEPQRCKACRQARKNAAKTEREFFETVCAECGGIAKIPFKPVEGKSYYCSECFAKRKAAE